MPPSGDTPRGERRRDDVVNLYPDTQTKATAVSLPSGTTCNVAAFRLHLGGGGDEAILHALAHPIVAESGGPAALSGAPLRG